MVSEKFKESFETLGLTGLTFAGPVSVVKVKKANRIRRKNLPEPPVYYLTYVAENGAGKGVKASLGRLVAVDAQEALLPGATRLGKGERRTKRLSASPRVDDV